MSLNQSDIGNFVSVARRVVELIDATTIAITDIQMATHLSRNQLAAMVNRYYAETSGAGGTPAPLAES